MSLFTDLFQIAFVLAVTAVPIAVSIRLLAGWTDEGGSLLQLTPMAWPRGVQEEEPQRWNLDRLTA